MKFTASALLSLAATASAFTAPVRYNLLCFDGLGLFCSRS